MTPSATTLSIKEWEASGLGHNNGGYKLAKSCEYLVPLSGINDKMASNFNTVLPEQWLEYDEPPLVNQVKLNCGCQNSANIMDFLKCTLFFSIVIM